MGSEGQTGSIETTALAAYVLIRADFQPDLANGALTFLVQQKDSFGTWHSTQATILALKALIQSVRGGGERVNATVTVTLNGGQARTLQVTPANFDVVQLISFDDVNPGAGNKVEIKAEGQGSLMYQVSGSYYLPWSEVAQAPAAEGEPLPPKVRRPSKDFNEQIAICQGFSFARRYGWSMAVGREDISCPLAKVVWGFEPMVDFYLNGMTCGGLYTDTPALGAITEAQTAKFEHKQYAYVVAAPLQRTEFEPDLILIYGNPAQVMRLVVAALYKRGGRLHASFSGRIDCSDEVIVTMQTDDYQVVLPCNGDRIFAQTQDDEMAHTIPASKIDEIVAGLEATHKNGIR